MKVITNNMYNFVFSFMLILYIFSITIQFLLVRSSNYSIWKNNKPTATGIRSNNFYYAIGNAQHLFIFHFYVSLTTLLPQHTHTFSNAIMFLPLIRTGQLFIMTLVSLSIIFTTPFLS